MSPERLCQNLTNTGGFFQPTIRLTTQYLMEELEKGIKDLKELATAQEEQQCEPTNKVRAPWDYSINQRVHMAPVANVAEYGLVGHQRNEEALALRRLYALI